MTPCIYPLRLSTQCQTVIKSVTQDEARYIELNPEVARVCKQVIKQNCMVSRSVVSTWCLGRVLAEFAGRG